MTDDIRWFAGVDWASEIHQVVLVDAQGAGSRANGPSAMAAKGSARCAIGC
jgi:hypothetical protein